MAQGLSPRVRGNLTEVGAISSSGSIPACTGEPPYPILNDNAAGLSPRVRGNHFIKRNEVYPRVYGGCPVLRVYPRVYGGTTSEKISLVSSALRGNLCGTAG